MVVLGAVGFCGGLGVFLEKKRAAASVHQVSFVFELCIICVMLLLRIKKMGVAKYELRICRVFAVVGRVFAVGGGGGFGCGWCVWWFGCGCLDKMSDSE